MKLTPVRSSIGSLANSLATSSKGHGTHGEVENVADSSKELEPLPRTFVEGAFDTVKGFKHDVSDGE